MSRFCAQCGQPSHGSDATRCANCGAEFAPAPAAPAAPAIQPPPWTPAPMAPPARSVPGIPFEEQPGIAGFFATVKGILTSPRETISGQKSGEGLAAALAFFLIIMIPAQVVGQLANVLMSRFRDRLFPPQPLPPGMPEFFEQWMKLMQNPTVPVALAMAVMNVFIGLVMLFISAGLIHALLRLLGGGREGYGATLKALCYSNAPMILAVVPMCGAMVGGLWALVLQFLLVGPAHREETGKGAMAVLFYYLGALLCLCGCIGSFIFLAAAGAAAAGGGG